MTDGLGTHGRSPGPTTSEHVQNGAVIPSEALRMSSSTIEQENGAIRAPKPDNGQFTNANHDLRERGNSRQQNGIIYERQGPRTTKEKVLKLTPSQIHELTSSPESLPLVAPSVDARITLDLHADVQGIPQGRRSSQPLSSSYLNQPYYRDENGFFNKRGRLESAYMDHAVTSTPGTPQVAETVESLDL
ncbi:MAG: hypothetical protein Q9174_005025, partial [Haloplaca sp. 1 TL-2023]